MRKKKWKKILIWVASIIVILGVGGLFAANYAVDKLISTLAADLEGDLLNEEPIGLDSNAKPNEQANKLNEEGATDTTMNTDKATVNPEKDGNNADNDKSDEKIDPAKSTESYSAEVSIEKAKDLQEKITVSEKAKLTSVFLKELSMADIKELQALASGGINQEEKKKARSIILDKLTPEQYDELIQIAKKYGMSQGKSYEEVVKEK
ncbi:hypothetical protein AB4Z50_07925 [Paenibacillus sp. 2TAB26]|uniref:hypothetical protein n=1 Tax=Paenibacillus sp. 2TAB26 TaxID=3233005 RepID=UPI003F9484F4